MDNKKDNYVFYVRDKRLANTLRWFTNLEYKEEIDKKNKGTIIYVWKGYKARIVKDGYLKLRDLRNEYHEFTKKCNL